MSSRNKIVKNGRGTVLLIDENFYISVGKDGKDVVVRGANKVLAFSNWVEFVDAIDTNKATYFENK